MGKDSVGHSTPAVSSRKLRFSAKAEDTEDEESRNEKKKISVERWNGAEEGGGGAVKTLFGNERGRKTRLKCVSPYPSLIDLAVTYSTVVLFNTVPHKHYTATV